MNEKVLNEYLLNDLDNRIQLFENEIDLYNNAIGVSGLIITGNVVIVSGSVTTSITAPNTFANLLTLNLTRSSSNSIANFTQYSNSVSLSNGLNLIRGGNTETSHIDVLQGMVLGGFSARPVVTGVAFVSQTTAFSRFYSTENQTSTNRGNAYEIILTPSGSATGRRRVFNIDSNGDTTLGNVSRIPQFDLWTKNINVTGNITPMVDNVFDLGSAVLRFNDVFAVNGVITVSDPSYKNSLRALSFSSSDFINSINVYEGKFNNSRSNRFHIFFNSHEIKEYFKKHNLDYGITVEDNGIVALRYQEIIPILLQNVKELNKKVEELNSKVTILEEMNKAFYIKIYEWIRGLF